MKGTASFQPVDVAFFDDVIGALFVGGKINPEAYLRDALRIRHVWWQARRFARGLELLATRAAAPEPSPNESFWTRVRTRLEKIDHRPEEQAVLADRLLERDLHLRGRPFFVTEGSAERVAEAVDRYRGASTEADAESEARPSATPCSCAPGRRCRLTARRSRGTRASTSPCSPARAFPWRRPPATG